MECSKQAAAHVGQWPQHQWTNQDVGTAFRVLESQFSAAATATDRAEKIAWVIDGLRAWDRMLGLLLDRYANADKQSVQELLTLVRAKCQTQMELSGLALDSDRLA